MWMKCNYTFFQLFKRECYSLCISPATYLASLFFLLSNAVYFFYINHFFVLNVGSSDLRFFFSFFPISLILVVPTLTMGLWPKHDIESILPITSLQYIVAKWLSTFTIVTYMVLSSLVIVFVVSFFGYVDIHLVLSSTIGVFFLSISLCAFGQLCTVLLKNQASSFFVTAIGLALFTFNGQIAQGSFFQNGVVSGFISFLSFSRNFDAFSKGIIDTRNVLFYLIVTLVCFLLSAFVLEKRKFGLIQTANRKRLQIITSLTCLFLLLGLWNSQVYYYRFDITSNKRFSLSEYTKEVIDSLDNTASITYFITPELTSAFPQSRDITDFLYEYSNYADSIHVRIVNPSTIEYENSLASLGITKLDIPTIKDNESLIIQGYSAVVVEYQNKTEVIPFLLDTSTLEYDIAGRIQSLSNSLNRSAFVLVGNDLSLSADYPLVVPFLENSGFSVKELTPNDILSTSNIDLNTPIIILGSSHLTENHIRGINSFIEVGGKVFFSVSPITIDLDTWIASFNQDSSQPMIDLLKTYGVVLNNSLLLDENSLVTRLLSSEGETVELAYPFFIESESINENNDGNFGRLTKGVYSLWPSPILLQSQETDIRPIIQTSSKSWLQEANMLLLDQTGEAFITNPFFDYTKLKDVESEKSHTIGVQISDTMVVISDQYFLSRGLSYIPQEYVISNFDFLINSLLWLDGHHSLIELKSKNYSNYTLNKITDLQLFQAVQRNALILLLVWYCFSCVIPYIYIQNKRKKYKRDFK